MEQVCLDKNGYETRKLAKQVAKRCLSKTNTKLNTYKCPFCGYFHLTSKVNMNYKIGIRDK